MRIFGFDIKVTRPSDRLAPGPVQRSGGGVPVSDWLKGADYAGSTYSNPFTQVSFVYRAITALAEQVEFATGVNPVARVAYGLYQGGFLNAVSVGFIPLKWVDGHEDDDWYVKYLEQELVEVSAVAVPANREALRLGLQTGVISPGAVHDAMEILGEALKDTSVALEPHERLSPEAWRFWRELRMAMVGELRVES